MNTLLLWVTLSAPAYAADRLPTAVEADNEVVARSICKNGAVERVLEVIPVDKGCVLRYTKQGKAEEKAKSVHGVQVCQDSMKKMVDRLQAGGFTCK